MALVYRLRNTGGGPPAPGHAQTEWGRMTDRIAFILAALIAGAVVLDLWLLNTGATLFVLRKLADLVEYLAFWR